MKITNYQDLKTFCESLSQEQLQQEVHLAIVDDASIKIESAHVSEQDEYFDHCDSLGTLELIKNEYPDEWEDMIEDATICPKGTVFLVNE